MRKSLACEASPQAQDRSYHIDEDQHREEVSVTPQDIQEDPRSSIGLCYIHPDRLFQINNTKDDISDSEVNHLQSEQLPRIVKEADQFIQISQQERKAFTKQKRIDALSCTRSGKVIAKPVLPLTKKQRNRLQTIPKNMLAEYLDTRE